MTCEVFTVEYQKRDRYGRIVGKALLDGIDVCLEQVKAGFAWHYKKYQAAQSNYTDCHSLIPGILNLNASQITLYSISRAF